MTLRIAALVWLMMLAPGAALAGTPPTTSALTTISSECGLIRSSDDYWLCVGLSQGPCEVATGDNYAMCQAISQSQCSLTSSGRDYWFCTSINDRSCGLNSGSRDYWLCEAIVQGSCGVVPGSDDHAWCEAMKAPLRRWFGLEKPEGQDEPARPSDYAI